MICSCIERRICPYSGRVRGTIWEIWASVAKEIFQGDIRETFCLCSCPYLFLFFCRLPNSDLALLTSYQLGQYRAIENDEERVGLGCDSSEAC